MTRKGGAVVSLSGGQDSTTCLHYALREYDNVVAVSFDYGQRHVVELKCAKQVAADAGVGHTILDIGRAFRQMGAASLTSDTIESREDATGTGNAYAAQRGLPSSFVPGRNIILLGYAAAHGLIYGCETLVTGVCAMDEAGYPDCRPNFISALEQTIRVGMDAPEFGIDAPLLYKTKGETFELAQKLGVLDTILRHTHTCYEGDHTAEHAWGYGCGECPACRTRAEGWAEFTAAAA